MLEKRIQQTQRPIFVVDLLSTDNKSPLNRSTDEAGGPAELPKDVADLG